MNTKQLGDFIAMKLGEASMCWSETPKGVFQDVKVTKILHEIMEQIEIEHQIDIDEQRKGLQLL